METAEELTAFEGITNDAQRRAKLEEIADLRACGFNPDAMTDGPDVATPTEGGGR